MSNKRYKNDRSGFWVFITLALLVGVLGLLAYSAMEGPLFVVNVEQGQTAVQSAVSSMDEITNHINETINEALREKDTAAFSLDSATTKGAGNGLPHPTRAPNASSGAGDVKQIIKELGAGSTGRN